MKTWLIFVSNISQSRLNKAKSFEIKINHVFTHFKLDCTVVFFRINKKMNKNLLINKEYRFVKKKDFNQLAIPSLINKILTTFEDKIY